jgi:prephenate dehydrogenase
VSKTDKPSKVLAERAVVVGVGLIGGSLAGAARRAGVVARVTGVGRSRANLDTAVAGKLVDAATTDLEAAVADADLVVLAAAPEASVDLLDRVSAAAPKSCVITDVVSVKQPICQAAERLGVADRFVGGHPMAGGTATGAAAADTGLFRGRVTVVTPVHSTGKRARDLVVSLWRAVGASVIELDAARHDRVVAVTSHLPQMLAFALCALAGGNEDADAVRKLVGAGFRDTVRLAASDVDLWSEIARANSREIVAAMDAFTALWTELREGIARGDDPAVRRTMLEASRFKRQLDEK